MIIYYIFAGLLGFGYAIIIARYMEGWHSLPAFQMPDDYKAATSISVIIPARNEAEQIEACLLAILQQDYPSHLYEVIVVDDFSTDQTPAIVQHLAQSHPHLKLLQLADYITDTTSVSSFKKRAIETAIQQSNATLILTTDADCIAPPKWLDWITAFYQKTEARMIAAPVVFHKETNRLQRFQSLDFQGMMCVTGAGIHRKFMHMCNGANLAYTKATFEEVDGFNGIDHIASGDDMLLLQKVVQRFPDSIGFIKQAQAAVRTEAKPDWQSFMQQRIRWASKSTSYAEIQVTIILGWVFVFCINILLSFLLIPFFGLPMLWSFLFQLSIKAVADFFFLRTMSVFFNRQDLMNYFTTSFFLHIAYIVSIGIISNLKKQYQWKGRALK